MTEWNELVLGVITADGDRIDELQADLADLGEKMQAIVDVADDEDRDLEDDEIAKIEKLQAKADRITKQIAARSAIGGVTAGRSRGRRAAPSVDDDSDDGAVEANGRSRGNRSGRRERASVPATPVADRATMGFTSFGEFAGLVHAASENDRVAMERFENVASTYGNESVGSEGGYLVPPD